MSRIVIYGMNYAPEIAATGRYTGEIGAHLAAEGHQVCVVTTPPHYPGWATPEGYSARRWTRETLAGAEVYRCPLYLTSAMTGVRRLLAPLTFALSSAPVVAWQILRRRPDVVLVVEPTLLAAPAAWVAARLAGARTVLHVQDLEVDAAFAVGHLGRGGLLARAATAFERAALRGFDRVITISNRMAERIAAKAVSTSKIQVIRNWVDLGQFHPEASGSSAYRSELGLSGDAFVVLYAGSLGVKQGVGLLLEAARRLAGRDRLVFLIAGDGPMRGAVETAAGEQPHIRRLDFQPERRLAEFLSLADLHVLPQVGGAADFVLPSKLGGMLASGRPILVTADQGGELAEFLGNSCAFTPPDDPEALASAIVRLMGDPPHPHQQEERLRRAGSLSKDVLIRAFAKAVLFEPSPDAAENRELRDGPLATAAIAGGRRDRSP